VRSQFEHGKKDSDLAGLRDETELVKPSAEDQEPCRAPWREGDARVPEPSRAK